MTFFRCYSCGSFRAENGEDVAFRVSILEKEITVLKQENARFRNALEKYADPKTHSMDCTGFVWSADYIDYETARNALRESE